MTDLEVVKPHLIQHFRNVLDMLSADISPEDRMAHIETMTQEALKALGEPEPTVQVQKAYLEWIATDENEDEHSFAEAVRHLPSDPEQRQYDYGMAMAFFGGWNARGKV